LGANENDLVMNLIEEEFIHGNFNESRQRTKEEEEIWSNFTKTMNEFQQTNNRRLFTRASTQNCSDLIINVGELVTSYVQSEFFFNFKGFPILS
jgi:hypothetical protein